jgi:Sulfotransferase family
MGGCRFAEKNPENSFLVPFLAAEFPGAQFVHIVRDGRDAAVSHAEQPWLNAASATSGRGGQLHGPGARWWVEPERREEFPLVPDIVRSAWCWRRFTEAALDGVAGLAAGRAAEIRYEAMVSDPAATADTLADFLGLSSAGRAELHASLARARPDSVGRRRAALGERELADVLTEIGATADPAGLRVAPARGDEPLGLIRAARLSIVQHEQLQPAIPAAKPRSERNTTR